MTEHKRGRHILFVDDELACQRLVVRVLMAGVPDARVTCASDGLQALQVLEREPVDLLITDLMMPGMDGIELLRQVANRQMLLPILVVTGQGSRTLETSALAGLAIECFEKPLAAEPFVGCVRELLEAAARRSYLEGVSIAGFVQLLSMEGKTCVLRATVPGAQGVLYFQAGQLVDARQAQLSGVAAALEVFTWKSPTITLEALTRHRPTTINAGIMELLLESARLADERERSQRRSSAQSRSSVRAEVGLAFAEAAEDDLSDGPEFAASLAASDPFAEPAPAQRPAIAASPAPPVAAPPSLSVRPAVLVPRKSIPPLPPPPRVSAPPVATQRSPAASRGPPVSVAGPGVALPATAAAPVVEALPAAAERVAQGAAASPGGVPETCDYFELVDRARDLMRVAEFETAETLLLRALVLRPGDRVIQQNLRALAKRRGA